MHHEELAHISFVLNSFPDDTIFYRINDDPHWINYDDLKRYAILLSLGKDISIRHKIDVDVDLYKVDFVYTDIQGDKNVITSNTDLGYMRLFYETDAIKVVASVKKKKDEQESPALESSTESSAQTVHSATSITTPATHEMVTYIVKLALVGSGGKKADHFTLT
jgi:hypothetical protein